jgi:quercetin dioxygenase-like cupin family protein
VNAHRHKPSLALADHASVIDDESVPWLPMSPQVEGVSIKYFRLDPPRGESVALLRAVAGARLPRQRHTGPVIVYTLAGRWKLQEEDWIAGPGSVVVLPASSAHTACVLEDSGEALVFAVASGERITLGPGNAPVAVQSCSSELRRYLDWCDSVRVVPRDLSQ